MEYGKRTHYDQALDLINEGSWRVDADRGVVYGRGRSRAAWRPIGTLRSGYLRLRIGYKGPSVSAHRVIWEFAYGPSDLGLTINHKNGVKTDNRIANLELVTNRQNVVHGFEMGLQSRASRNVGSKNAMAKLTEERAAEIRRRRAAGERGRALAAEFEISEQAVCNIHKGRGWQ